MRMLRSLHWMEIKYIYHRWNAQESVKLRVFCHTRFRDLPFSISLLTGSLVYLQWGRLADRKINVSGVFCPLFLFLSLSPGKKRLIAGYILRAFPYYLNAWNSK